MSAARFRAACYALAAAPIALAVWFVQGFSLRVPLFDHWAVLPLFAGFSAGHPSFLAFLAPHNGLHVTVLPRVLLATLATVTGWSFRAEIFFSFSLGAYAVWILSVALRESLPEGDFRTTRAVATALTAAVLFSPASDWIWTWSIGFYHYFENAAVATAVWALAARRPRLGVAAAACAVATFNRFEGLFSWVLFLPAVASASRAGAPGGRGLRRFVLVGGVASACVLALLVLVRPPELGVASGAHPPGFVPLALANATSLVGMAPGVAGELPGSGFLLSSPFVVPGLVVVVGFGWLSVAVLRSGARRSAALAWVGLGLFGFAFAFATAVARSGLAAPALVTLARLYQSSYSETASLVAVAAIHLGAIRHATVGSPGARNRLFPVLAGLLAVVLALGTARAWPRLLSRREYGHWDRYCLELANYLAPENACFVGADGAHAMERARFATLRHGLPFLNARDPRDRIETILSEVDPLWGMRSMSVRGIVALDDDSEGTVALAFEGEHAFFALAARVQPAGPGRARFFGAIPVVAVHPGRTRVNAWVYDRAKGYFRPVGGTVDAVELIDPS